MRILFIAAHFEPPKYLQSWAQEHRFELRCSSLDKEEGLPQASEFDLLILAGGIQPASCLNNFPFLMNGIQLVKNALAADKIVLGFCLGAQMIGEAYGTGTEPSPYSEMGIFPVQLTQEGRDDPLLKGISPTFPAIHWHDYMPGLPKTAKVLAISEGCPRQIVRYSSKVYGFQCRPETASQEIRKEMAYLEEDFRSGPYIQPREDFFNSDFTSIHRMMASVLDNLIALSTRFL